MGTSGEPRLSAVAGTGHDDDEVKRCKAFAARHPRITVTSPRANGTHVYRAAWADDGVTLIAAHEKLRCLLDYLEARFDR